jgi:hypothetical protein
MAIPSFYLETSVWGSLAPRQPRDRKQIVQQLFHLLDGVRGICVISAVVQEEIEQAPARSASMIYRQMEKVLPIVIPIVNEVRVLAGAYIQAGVIPARRVADAIHVAATTHFEVDYLLSWNHRHMTRPLLRRQFETVNQAKGYNKTPVICNPLEACHEIRNRPIP